MLNELFNRSLTKEEENSTSNKEGKVDMVIEMVSNLTKNI